MRWTVVRAKDSENIDFPVETAWSIATKKNSVRINDKYIGMLYVQRLLYLDIIKQ